MTPAGHSPSGQQTQLMHMSMHVYMYIQYMYEGRKKEASKVKQTTWQCNTAHSNMYKFPQYPVP